MRKQWKAWLLTLCMGLFCWSRAGALDVFGPEKLRTYAEDPVNPASLVTFWDGTEDGASWRYYLYEDAMGGLTFDNGEISGEASLLVGVMGTPEYGLPFLALGGTLDREIRLRRQEIRVGNEIYEVDFTGIKGYSSVTTDSEGTHFSLLTTFGSPGIEWLNSLLETGGAMTVRTYYEKDAYFELALSAGEAYGLFYLGLVEAGYLDTQGELQASMLRLLTRGIDKNAELPTITVAKADPDRWPDATPEPQAAQTIGPEDGEAQAVLPTPAPETASRPTSTPYVEPAVALSMTRYGEWGIRSKRPWIRVEIQNDSAQFTVTEVTFTFYCLDKDGNRISTVHGEDEGAATLERTIRPGQKATLERFVIDGFWGVKEAYVSIASYTLEDGTVVELSPRQMLYWMFLF